MSFETRTLLSPDVSRQLLLDLGKWEENGLQDLRIAVLGFGKMGIMHSAIMNLLKPNSVKAVVDKSRLLTFGGSRVTKNTKFYTDLDKMLVREQPDVVCVTTPTASHHSLLSKLARCGMKYVFVEKPPTIKLKELLEISRIKKKSQVIMVGFQKRFALPFRHARILLSNGIIGNISSVHSYIRSGDIMAATSRFDSLERGVLLDLGIHLVDLLTWFFGANAVKQAFYRSVYTKVDDYFKAELVGENSVGITMEVTWSDQRCRQPETYIEVQGSLGTLKVTEDFLKVEMVSADTPGLVMFKPNYYQSLPPVNLGDPEYVLEDIHFLSCICSSTRPLTSLEEVTTTMTLIDRLCEKAVPSIG
jgi:predicted dehydrogenase